MRAAVEKEDTVSLQGVGTVLGTAAWVEDMTVGIVGDSGLCRPWSNSRVNSLYRVRRGVVAV